jgi:hypothetical protein
MYLIIGEIKMVGYKRPEAAIDELTDEIFVAF